MAQTDHLVTAAVSVVTSVVTTLTTTYITRRLHKRHKEADDKQKAIADRLNPDLNVIRAYHELRLPTGRLIPPRTWFVNPYWFTVEGEVVRVRGWENVPVFTSNYIEEGELHRHEYVPFVSGHVKQAKMLRAWVRLDDVHAPKGAFLNAAGYEPCTADEAHLFQPLPEEPKRRRLFGR